MPYISLEWWTSYGDGSLGVKWFVSQSCGEDEVVSWLPTWDENMYQEKKNPLW